MRLGSKTFMSDQQNINVKISDEMMRGAYSNMMLVSHSKEEFILDFLNIFPLQKQGLVTSRIIVSPGHLKRLSAAIADNLAKYETQFGKIEEAGPVSDKEIGFKIQ